METIYWVLAAVLLVMTITAILSRKKGKRSPVTFTFYHLPGCKYCYESMPEWKLLEHTYRGSVQLRKVNALHAPREVNRLGIDAFPAFVLFGSRTGHAFRYDGVRSAAAFRRFLSERATYQFTQ